MASVKGDDPGPTSGANDATQPEYSPPIESPVTPEPLRQTLSHKRTDRLRRVNMVDGRYELEEVISQGGMARVFRARHRDLGRSFAIKVVKDALKDDPRMRAQFFTEARLASSLGHPNIIQVTDYGIDAHLGCYLVMELLEGETLRERMNRLHAPLRVAFDVMDQISGAVRYIHGRGIVHCDLKPENVFLARVDGEPRRVNAVKLLDFGLSWREESLPDPTLGGTPPYLAPERLAGDPPAPTCDVYSLGVLLYELLTGRWPYTGTLTQIMDQQLRGAVPPPPSDLSQEAVGATVDALLFKALTRNPGERQPSAEAFHFELRSLMRQAGMKVRRRTLLSDSAMPSLGSGDLIAQAIAESPIPLAIFEPGGQVRFANRAFTDLVEGPDTERLPRFDELRVVARDPGLLAALAQAVATGKPVRRLVLLGARGGERMQVLLLHAALDGSRVESVHATIVDTRLE